jgi:hypothetical protein
MEIQNAKKLKIGDKVRCLKSFEYLPQKNWIGKIVIKEESDVGVEWEKEFNSEHNCDEHGENNKCRYYYFDDDLNNQSVSILELIKKPIKIEVDYYYDK